MSASPFFASFVALSALLAAAASAHVRSRRIPDALVVGGVVVALLLHGWSFVTRTPSLAGPWWGALAGLYAGVMVMVPLYLMRGCRGDVVKLMATVGAFIGPVPVLWAGVYATGVTALMWLGYFALRAVRSQVVASSHVQTGWGTTAYAELLASEPVQRTAVQLPCAVAIAAATLMAMRNTVGGVL